MTNIVPDKSTDVEVIAALHTCQAINQSQIVSREFSTLTTISWQLPLDNSARVEIVDHIVASKYYVVNTLTSNRVDNRGIPVQKLFERYGTPEFVERGELNDPHGCIAYIILYYPSKGFSSDILDQYDCGKDIDTSTIVSTSAYRIYQPGTIEDVLRKAYLSDEESTRRRLLKLRRWTGFDSIKK